MPSYSIIFFFILEIIFHLTNLYDNKVHEYFFLQEILFLKKKETIIGVWDWDSKSKSMITNDEIVFFLVLSKTKK